MALTTAISGYFSSLSLIAAIGAQNALVLRQGLRGQHILPLVLLCAGSDAILISVGVAGFSTMASLAPWLTRWMLYFGAGFLIIYGALRFHAAWRDGAALLPAPDQAPDSRAAILGTCLVLTWANPHVYLDTIVLLGAISAQHTPHQWSFGLGAVLASFSFFFALGYGARLLSPLFANAKAWVWLEIIIGCVMWAIAASLISQAYII